MIRRDDGGDNGGALRLTPEMLSTGARPGWYPYLHVRDVEAAVTAIIAGGGQVIPW